MFVKQIKSTKEKVCIVYHPYDYFDAELHKYAVEGKSLLFADDMLQNMKNLAPDEFLLWLQSIHYNPLIDPVTALLSPKKNLNGAVYTLHNHDYVVPHEHLSEFLKHIDLETPPPEPLSPSMDFSIAQATDKTLIDAFIGKDMQIYDTAKKLWDTIRSNDYKSLGKPKRYEGFVDGISPTMIAGWVFDIDSPESQTVHLYKNDMLIEKAYANILRPGVKKNKNHPTGLCGFRMEFSSPVLTPTDKIKVCTEDGTFVLPFAKNTSAFFDATLPNQIKNTL